MAINKVEICGMGISTLPVLKNERMRELFPKIHAGDKDADLRHGCGYCSRAPAFNAEGKGGGGGMTHPCPAGQGYRALTKPTTAKIALIYEKSEAIFASGVSKTCILRSLTSM